MEPLSGKFRASNLPPLRGLQLGEIARMIKGCLCRADSLISVANKFVALLGMVETLYHKPRLFN